MSAYATAQIGRSSLSSAFGASRTTVAVAAGADRELRPVSYNDASSAELELMLLDALFDKLAARVAAAVLEHRRPRAERRPWRVA
jgi:hypothetical protein